MAESDPPEKQRNKGSGDPVQRAARDARIKQNLRTNLMRRKQKARILKTRENGEPEILQDESE